MLGRTGTLKSDSVFFRQLSWWKLGWKLAWKLGWNFSKANQKGKNPTEFPTKFPPGKLSEKVTVSLQRAGPALKYINTVTQ